MEEVWMADVIVSADDLLLMATYHHTVHFWRLFGGGWYWWVFSSPRNPILQPYIELKYVISCEVAHDYGMKLPAAPL